jgi:hypothetical protein
MSSKETLWQWNVQHVQKDNGVTIIWSNPKWMDYQKCENVNDMVKCHNSGSIIPFSSSMHREALSTQLLYTTELVIYNSLVLHYFLSSWQSSGYCTFITSLAIITYKFANFLQVSVACMWSDNKVSELITVKVLHTSLLNITVVAFKVPPLGSYALMPVPT